MDAGEEDAVQAGEAESSSEDTRILHRRQKHTGDGQWWNQHHPRRHAWLEEDQ